MDPGSASDAELSDRACRYLARRDRSRAEMQRYLERYCDDDQVVSRLLDDLQQRGLLSESRLADQVIRSRRARASAGRIRQEMARRGISDDVIAQSTEGLDGGDLNSALALWRKRFRTPPADRSQRERQLRFLLNRGFSLAIALKVLRTAGASED
jgi:regulatory protein